MSVDTLHIGGPDCAGNQWNLTMLMNSSGLGMCQGTARQDSATAAKVIAKTINYIEAKTDPGTKQDTRSSAATKIQARSSKEQ